jgi:hypothetical protein
MWYFRLGYILFLVTERGDMQWLDHLQKVWEYEYISLSLQIFGKIKVSWSTF